MMLMVMMMWNGRVDMNRHTCGSGETDHIHARMVTVHIHDSRCR